MEKDVGRPSALDSFSAQIHNVAMFVMDLTLGFCEATVTPLSR
jgi:hypothetical protein